MLVSMAVIALLIAILMPGLSRAHEAARRVFCASNLRQIGLGVAMYADSNKSEMPGTMFLDSRNEMLRLRVADARTNRASWDGLGYLFSQEYLNAPKIFYCPSHFGSHHYRVYSEQWLKIDTELVGNFQFRGTGPNEETRLDRVEPQASAIVTDGMRTITDYNHRSGCNVLRADLAVIWLNDINGQISRNLARTEQESTPAKVNNAWQRIDAHTNGGPLPGR